MFKLLITESAREQLNRLKKDKNLKKKYSLVKKAIKLLASNPRHISLQTHEYTSLKGPNREKVFEAYIEQNTPGAYRLFWFYGPNKLEITIVSIIQHP